MILFYRLIIFLIFFGANLVATEFTISSYNCGGLSDHYDYLRAACMQKLMQERYNSEPKSMALNEKIQKIALKILFAEDSKVAQEEWNQNEYGNLIHELTANTLWSQKVDELITSYRVRPVLLMDEEVNQLIQNQVQDITRATLNLTETRAVMAKRIFHHYLKYDIICLQEADYLTTSMFPDHYKAVFSDTSHSKNGIAWDNNRFNLIELVGNILDHAFAVKLLDTESGKTILVASGHISGCNPYHGEADSKQGDTQLQTIIELFDKRGADMMVIGMDSNVTALHPRLSILKEGGYKLDYENYLEATCTNPYVVLDTRIDWISVKSGIPVSIVNIPVLSVGLNCIQTNISDHKPIAAKITY